MSEKTFRPGDAVTWSSTQGAIAGTVKRKLTRPTKIKGHDVAASTDNPEYLVESAKTGALAAHKPAALKPKSKSKSAATSTGKSKATSTGTSSARSAGKSNAASTGKSKKKRSTKQTSA